MSKLLCVVISCYNSEKTILKTLDSLKNQDYDMSLYDIIIADNDSQDNTKKIIRNLEQENVSIACYINNLGLYANWNRAFALAKEYKYITNIHTDDTIDTDHLSLLISSIKDNDACIPQLKMSNGTIWKAPDNITLKEQIQINKIPIFCMIKKEVWDELEGYKDYDKHDFCDWDFWIRFLMYGYKYNCTPKPTYNYSLHGVPFNKASKQYILDKYRNY